MTFPDCPRCNGTGEGPPDGADLRSLREESKESVSLGAAARAYECSTTFLSEIETSKTKKKAPREVVNFYLRTFGPATTWVIGDDVGIYRQWATLEGFEGTANLSEFLYGDDDSETWMVRFKNEPKRVYRRRILR